MLVHPYYPKLAEPGHNDLLLLRHLSNITRFKFKILQRAQHCMRVLTTISDPHLRVSALLMASAL